MIDDRHTCGNDCACPIHRTPLIYSPAGDDHACQDPSCEHGGGMGAGWRPPLFPVLPEGIGALLSNLLAEPEWQPGEPYVHTFREPDPVPVLNGDGQPMLDEAGEPMVSWALMPTHSLSHVTMPSMRDLVGPDMFGTPVLPPAFLPLETPSRRIARILTDAGWTDATLGAATGNRRWLTDDCPSDCAHAAVEHWHGWFCDAPYVASPGGILEQPDFSGVAVKVMPPIRGRGRR